MIRGDDAPPLRDRRRKNSFKPTRLVSLTARHKRLAVAKLDAVYGIRRRRWTWRELSLEIARVLKVPEPDELAARGLMIVSFGAARGGPPVGEDRVAALAARFPFTPLTLSRGMRDSLARVEEYRRLGRSRL